MFEYYVMQKDASTGEVFEHGPFMRIDAVKERDFYIANGYADSYIFRDDV